jgi:hypothetical protein
MRGDAVGKFRESVEMDLWQATFLPPSAKRSLRAWTVPLYLATKKVELFLQA